MRLGLILALLTLAACGADGPPTAPTDTTAVSVTGEAVMGIATGPARRP